MNPRLDLLQPYPFQKLAGLLAGIEPPRELDDIRLSIGEPRHPTPAFLHEAVHEHLDGLARYPLTKGSPALREAIADWLMRRFALPAGSVDPERHVLPVNGTREALFALAQAVIDPGRPARVLMPNPFYQIYEGAALLAGGEPVYLNCTAETGFLPDFEAVPDATWDACQLLYLCSPANPTGAVLPIETLQQLIERAERHDFVIASDECYSEIYQDEDAPPPGLLQAAAALGETGWRRCVVFHSLSKRSNAPGLRSGFVAGDADLLARFLLYRTYHGCAMSPVVQAASIAAWRDERHVQRNRALYREKFAAVHEVLAPVLDVTVPPAGFYLWPRLPVPDEDFARRLYRERHVTVLPGRYLSREADGINPGAGHVRMALVAERDECVTAAGHIRELLERW